MIHDTNFSKFLISFGDNMQYSLMCLNSVMKVMFDSTSIVDIKVEFVIFLEHQQCYSNHYIITLQHQFSFSIVL